MTTIAIVRIFGALILGFGLAMALPAIIALIGDEPAIVGAFAGGAGLAIFIGVSLLMTTRGVAAEPSRRDLIIVVVLGWPLCGVLGALPFYIAGATAGWPDAILEAVSGLTTTGLSFAVAPLTDPSSLHFWRAELQWIGGLATIILAFSILPHLGIGSGAMASTTGDKHQAGTLQRLQLSQAVRRFVPVYAGLTGLCLVALWIAGVSGFDALCTAMSTVATGGFMTPNGRAAASASAAVQLVLILFMIAGALNFMLHADVLKGRFGGYVRNLEGNLLATLALFGALAGIVTSLFYAVPHSLWTEGRIALFQVVSAATTTGFSLDDAGSARPDLILPILIVLALAALGGSSGSTAGGLKLLRGALLIRQSRREIHLLIRPHAIIPVKIGGHSVSDDQIQGTWAYFTVYLFCLIVLAVGLAAADLGFTDAMPLAISALANAGPLPVDMATGGVDLGGLKSGAKWLLGAAMILGRLEVLAVLVILSPAFWRR